MAEAIGLGRVPAANRFESVLAKLRQKKKEISPDQIDTAYERTINSDVRYRFVIDMANA